MNPLSHANLQFVASMYGTCSCMSSQIGFSGSSVVVFYMCLSRFCGLTGHLVQQEEPLLSGTAGAMRGFTLFEKKFEVPREAFK